MLKNGLWSSAFVFRITMAVALRVQKEIPTDFRTESYFDLSDMPPDVEKMANEVSDASHADGWHRLPTKNGHTVYGLIHIPKAAGSSFAVDAGKYIPEGDGYYSEEICPDEIMRKLKAKGYKDSRYELLVFLRAPRAHVYSQYLELVYDKIWNWGPKKQFVKDCPNITAFLDRFTVGPGANHIDYPAYHPQDMQTRSVTCETDNHRYHALSTEDLNKALDYVKTYKFVGITEFYQASMCLFIDRVDPGSPLPHFCDCTNQTAWAAFPHHHESHFVPKHSLHDLSAADLKKIDQLTPKDVRLYKAGVNRFYEDVRELEKRRALRIHCH